MGEPAHPRQPEEAARPLGPGAQVVTVFPDRMERYFSTELIQPRD